MRDLFFVLDQGTTEHKLVIFERFGKILDLLRAEAPAAEMHRDGLSFDPDHITLVSNMLITMALQKYENRFFGFGFANQGETVVAWSKKTGEPLSRAVSWQCEKSEKYLKKNKIRAARIKELAGLPPSAYFSAAKMMRLLDVNPLVKSAARVGTLQLATLDAWMISRWTKKRLAITDPTTACRTQLFDIRSLRWSPELLKTFGVAKKSLPKILPCDGFAVLCDAGPFAPQPLPLLASLCDQPAALIGHDGLKRSSLKITLGTGAFVDLSLKRYENLPGVLTSVLFQGKKGTHYYLEGSVLRFAAALKEEKFSAAILKKLARAVAEVVEKFKSITKIPQQIFVDGGLCHNKALLTALGVALGKNVIARENLQMTALGVAQVVMKKIGKSPHPRLPMAGLPSPRGRGLG